MIRCVKKHNDAVIPSRAHHRDVGYDLTAIRKHKVYPNGGVLYDTGLAVSPPEGY